MKKELADSLSFTPQQGGTLRELMVLAGLSQEQLCVRMGRQASNARSPGIQTHRVAGLLKDALEVGLLPEHDIRLVHAAVKEMFRRQRKARESGLTSAACRVATRRPRLIGQTRLPETTRRNDLATAMTMQAVAEKFHTEKVDVQVRMRWPRRFEGLVSVGLQSRSGVSERDTAVAQIGARALETARAQQLPAIFFAALEKWRPAG